MSRCPDHDLPLVPRGLISPSRSATSAAAWTPAEPAVAGSDDVWEDGRPERVDPFDLRFGKGWVFFGATLMFVAFPLPLVRTRFASRVMEVSALSFSATAPGLPQHLGMLFWVTPLLALALLWLMTTRTSKAALRSLRVAVPLLVLVSATALFYGIFGFFRGAAAAMAGLGVPVQTNLRVGAYVAALGLLLTLVGGFRLGKGSSERGAAR